MLGHLRPKISIFESLLHLGLRRSLSLTCSSCEHHGTGRKLPKHISLGLSKLQALSGKKIG